MRTGRSFPEQDEDVRAPVVPPRIRGGNGVITAEPPSSTRRPALRENEDWPAPIARSPVQALAKRAIDVTVSLALLVPLAPAFPLLALIIKRDSPGPVLFNQKRVGRGGREFLMYKFRTMVPDAEARLQDLQHLNEGGAYMIRIKDDPRVTRVGRFLRRSTIDELPQLLNVLKGEMSLVGPRPQAPNEVALYTPEERRRLAMRPGMTGWWQVTDRHVSSFPSMVARDLEYIERWSLRMDALIAVRTVGLIVGEVAEHLLGSQLGPGGMRRWP